MKPPMTCWKNTGCEAVDPPVDAHDDDGGQEGHHRHEQAAPSSSDIPRTSPHATVDTRCG